MQTNNALTARNDDGFDLDVSTVEHTERISDLVRSTDDGCGSTCGACTTGVQ